MPRFNQVGGLTEALDLVGPALRRSECVNAAASLTQSPMVPRLLASFSLGDHVFFGLRGFAMELRGLVGRFPSLMSRPTVTDFPEGTAPFCTRCFVGGQLFENSLEAVAKSSQVHSNSSS